jgi:hypothetical protein
MSQHQGSNLNMPLSKSEGDFFLKGFPKFPHNALASFESAVSNPSVNQLEPGGSPGTLPLTSWISLRSIQVTPAQTLYEIGSPDCVS